MSILYSLKYMYKPKKKLKKKSKTEFLYILSFDILLLMQPKVYLLLSLHSEST